MAISLKKGQKIDLTKRHANLDKIRAELGWDISAGMSSHAFDLDCSVFLVASNDKVKNDYDFVFYNNKTSTDNSVNYGGDNRTGEGEGADETVQVELSKVSSAVKKIMFTVTIHDYDVRRQNFGMVNNAFISIVNEIDNAELVRFSLDQDFSIETSVVIASLYRNGSDWDFNAIGEGLNGGLAELCQKFGVNVG